jgi:tRNA dimethylallyltransferase
MTLEETGHDVATRAELERRLVGEGLHVLVAELRSAAPTVAAQTDLANPRRVVRALERAAVHGDRLPPEPRGYPARSVWIGLNLEPSVNARWIEDRARAQFASGLLDEAAALRSRYETHERAFSAVGYQEAFAVLDGESSSEAAIERTALRTRQFAKRQRTWFRAEPDINWLAADGGDVVGRALAIVLSALARGGGAR